MKRRNLKLVVSVMALGLMAAACSSDSTTDTTVKTGETTTTAAASSTSASTGESTVPGSTPGSTPGTSGTTAPGSTPAGTDAASTTPGSGSAGQPSDADLLKWGIDYTGGKAGAASGEPIKIGYVNQEDFFPENTIGINAAVEYVNKDLGGAAGRPIEIVPCKVSTPEDGAKCGAQLANDPSVNIVVTGTLLYGNKELYDSLNGKKAVVIGNGVTTDDFTTAAGQSFTAGSPGVIPSLAGVLLQYIKPDAKKVAILASDNPAGQAAANSLLKPIFDKAGITTTIVPVADTANAADVQTAMNNVGAADADAFIPIVTIQQCINVYDAIKALGINPIVITTGLCFGTPMTDHLKEAGESGPVPDGWYFGGYGYSYFTPDLASGMATYIKEVKQYGKPAPGATSLEYTGFAGPSFANIMTITKFMNELGSDKLDYASLNEKVRTFSGPMMLQVGPLACGKNTYAGIPFPVPCATEVGFQQFKGGEWISIADGLNGKPIDATKV